MNKESGYKIIIGIMLFIIIIQWAFIVRRPKRIIPTKIPVAIKGKIAIVIDDWGYNLNNVNIIRKIKQPVTCSVLPNLAYSKEVAGYLQAHGCEIILHLPLEPHEKYRLEQNTISTSMDAQTISNIVSDDLDNIVYAKGASNHMGSRATEDLRTMEIVFKELKKRHLYFLDSFVSSKSICADLARKVIIGFAKRDVFLDNEEEYGYIRKQIYKLKAKAKIHGRAIGIGHDRRLTLEVLKEVMPELEKEGYRFVFVSELLN